MIRGLSAILMSGAAVLAMAGSAAPGQGGSSSRKQVEISVLEEIINPGRDMLDGIRRVLVDSVPAGDEGSRYTSLTEEDFLMVAKELDVELAVIKAVVSIEAGKEMKGFWAPGIPVVNFDPKMYARFKNKVPSKAGAKGEKVPEGLSGHALKEWTQLVNARKSNAQGANMGTFWGMFQIGGFNYKLCGCSDVDEFVRVMSESEFSQLELFAKFITNAGMLPDLRKKNWAGFARKYNGASYARRGYHTRMAAAYKKFKAESK